MTPERRRAVGVVLGVVAGMVACALLGWWQLERHLDRAAQVGLITDNLDRPAEPLAELLPGEDLAAGDVWRTASVTGEWVDSSGVQLRNRPVQDANASHALALFRTDETPARVLVVDRGWWRQTDVVPDGALEVPGSGPTTIEVRLRAQEDLDSRPNPAGEVFRVHPVSVLEQSGLAAGDLDGELVESAYGMITDPPPSGVLGGLPDPDTSLRSHLSYALQWWFFGAALPVGAVIIKRRGDAEVAALAQEAQEARAGADGGASPSGARRPARRRRTSMEDEEDALLDAAEAAERAARDVERVTPGR
ncbi:SURF1 family protein [Litorihabitans aurantiacus]|uniref:SURF1-like protein n=1 Tax=Litorihabitans aurantiacus TaxID=1930061 RepID=A0AA37UI88_9MICO|nr:SURF1 family protein [Litorihabitans aurantiacus]GMA31044.1 hypothetical protein GCM10025875_10360 [Litorihabitans aurantiacus]